MKLRSNSIQISEQSPEARLRRALDLMIDKAIKIVRSEDESGDSSKGDSSDS